MASYLIMITHSPKISIIVPVHNTFFYLSSCIESLLSQTLKDFEIILVENGSTDESIELCKYFTKIDSRIKLIQIDKADLSSARNAGLRIAAGEYIAFVDSDDTVSSTMYEQMYSLASENNLSIVSCNFCKKYPNGKIKYCYSQDNAITILSSKEATTSILTGKIPVTVWSMLYHRSLFKNLIFPEDIYFEDRASTFRFMGAAQKVGIINKALYFYTQRQQSIIHSKKSFKKLQDYITGDIYRLRFINESGMYISQKEKADVAYKTANHLIEKIGYMCLRKKSTFEKEKCKKLISTISYIPDGTSMSLKSHLFLVIIRSWEKLYSREHPFHSQINAK